MAILPLLARSGFEYKCLSRHPVCFPGHTRTMNRLKKASKVAEGKAGKVGSVDPRYTIIKEMLYNPAQRSYAEPVIKSHTKLSPVYIESDTAKAQEDTIERAWLLFKQNEKKIEEERIQKVYQSMHSAMEHLKINHPAHFKEALIKDEAIYVPKMFRIATHNVSPTLGWDYEMNRNE